MKISRYIFFFMTCIDFICWVVMLSLYSHGQTDSPCKDVDQEKLSVLVTVTSLLQDKMTCISVIVFTAWCYASGVLAMGLCLCLSVCLSVTSRSSTKTAKRRITQTTSHDSPGTLVFGCQRSPRNSTEITPCGGAKYRWGGSKSATFDK